MSNGSSSSPGNTESSGSSSQDSDATQENTQILRLLPSSTTLRQIVSSQSPGTESLPGVPTQAESVFVWLLNQTRIGEQLLPDPTGPRTIASGTPVKWAVLSVLSTRCWLSIAVIRSLLLGLSYPCSRFSIRRALKRCTKFGLTEQVRQPPWGSIRWKMTLGGRSLINDPRKPMKEPVAKRVKTTLEQATRWLSVSDINIIVNANRSTVRRCLRRDPSYKSETIPGDHCGSQQWALRTTDTTNWDNATPASSANKSKRPKQSATTGSSVVQSQHVTYGGLTLMCAPNKPTLIRAIGDLLSSEFVSSGKTFSAYDVTKRLRELVFAKSKEISDLLKNGQTTTNLVDSTETGMISVKGLQVPKIDHEDVRVTVHEIFNLGGMPGLGRRHVHSTPGADGYWEYDTQANIDAVVVAGTGTASGSSTATATGSTTDPDPISGGTMGSTYDGTSTI